MENNIPIDYDKKYNVYGKKDYDKCKAFLTKYLYVENPLFKSVFESINNFWDGSKKLPAILSPNLSVCLRK